MGEVRVRVLTDLLVLIKSCVEQCLPVGRRNLLLMGFIVGAHSIFLRTKYRSVGPLTSAYAR